MRILSWIATALFISAGIDLIKLIVVLRKNRKGENIKIKIKYKDGATVYRSIVNSNDELNEEIEKLKSQIGKDKFDDGKLKISFGI